MPIIVTVEEEPQVCIAGDTNNDGSVNVTDVVSMVDYILNLGSDDNSCFDMDGNGFINVVDVVYVVNIILGVFLEKTLQIMQLSKQLQMSYQ